MQRHGAHRANNPLTDTITVRLQLNQPSQPIQPASPSPEPVSPALTPSILPSPRKIPASVPKSPHYYSSSLLEETPRILNDFRTEMTQVVSELVRKPSVLRILLNEDGTVDNVLLDAPEANEQIADSLRKAFQNWKFHPGMLNGQAVKSELVLAVDGDDVSQTSPPR